MAASFQLLLVCTFICGIVVRLYEDISTDVQGSPELAYRYLGLHSSEQAVAIMIIVAMCMILVLSAALVTEGYMKLIQMRLEAKWSVATLDPPTCTWERRQVYACFLSHYKMEAASDARYMHDILRRMLKTPVFLDSSTLNDLRKLITDGVHKSDTIVFLGTPGVLSRPWCLLELLEAARKKVPVIVVQMNTGFEFKEALHFVDNLEDEMMVVNPEGLLLLRQQLGQYLGELKREVLTIVQANAAAHEKVPLVFNSHSGDNAMLAVMKDIVEAMANATRRTVKWSDNAEGKGSSKHRRPSRNNFNWCSSGGRKGSFKGEEVETQLNDGKSMVFLCCSQVDVLPGVRVLRSHLAMKLNHSCGIGGGGDTEDLIKQSELMVVLLTKGIVTDNKALYEVWMALQNGVPVITVSVSGGGYDFVNASKALAEMASNDQDYSLLRSKLPDRTEFKSVAKGLHSSLTSIIAISWSPNGGTNQLDAVANDIIERKETKKRVKQSLMSMKRLSLADVAGAIVTAQKHRRNTL